MLQVSCPPQSPVCHQASGQYPVDPRAFTSATQNGVALVSSQQFPHCCTDASKATSHSTHAGYTGLWSTFPDMHSASV